MGNLLIMVAGSRSRRWDVLLGALGAVAFVGFGALFVSLLVEQSPWESLVAIGFLAVLSASMGVRGLRRVGKKE